MNDLGHGLADELQRNTTVRAVYKLARNNKWSREQMLLMMVRSLVENQEALVRANIDLQSSHVPMVIFARKDPEDA